ncbi:CMD domain-containing protein [Pelagibacterium lacus]|uniref:CMD domain protein n=1 Tax=Pelagibacterium lacus TaxID=2282655 RepID=A0A369W5X0_9HYPH|nr:hypothetical protein [Pelagibacterium lacus]RDE09265.1 hypothetical protein DVH29_07340 [Pelagibacterium lacus]
MATDTLNAVLEVGPALAELRARRPEFVGGTEDCRAAVLAPEVDVGLGRPLRAALAARMARLNGDEPLAAHYRQHLAEAGGSDDLDLIVAGGYPSDDPRLRAILRHVDFITVAPRACTRADTLRLNAAGVSVPEVVALSELIGFVNFEVRIAATLRLLEAGQ